MTPPESHLEFEGEKREAWHPGSADVPSANSLDSLASQWCARDARGPGSSRRSFADFQDAPSSDWNHRAASTTSTLPPLRMTPMRFPVSG
jgi:hypothetical protein